MRFYINSKEIDLPEKYSLKYIRSSTCFNPLQGIFSIPSTILATPNNAERFNYPHIPSIASNPREEFEAEIWVGSFRLIKGTAKVVSSTEATISITVEALPANVSKALWQRNLNELDLGTETIPTLNVTSDHYWKISWLDTNMGVPVLHVDYRYYRCILLIDGQVKGDLGLAFLENSEKTFVNFKAAFTDLFEKANIDGIIITANDTHISLKFEGLATDIKLKFQYDFSLFGNYTNFTDCPMAKISYTTINQTYYNGKIDNEKYALPKVQDDAFYTETLDWCGYINQQNAGVIELNTDAYQNRNTVIPQIKFMWLIGKIMEVLGYTHTGAFFDNSSIQKLLLFNLYSTDKQASETAVTFNVHNNVIQYAKHLPKISISSFFQALADEFALGIEFNPFTNVAEFFFIKDALNANDFLDLSGRISFKHDSQFQDLKFKQLKWTVSNDEMVTDTEPIFQPFPADAVIESNKDKYVGTELLFPSLVVTEVGGVRQAPQIEQVGISPLFGQSKNENPKRLLFWDGSKADNQTASMHLSLYGTNNLYNLFHNEKIDFDNYYLPLKATAQMSIAEIAGFDFKKKIVAYNVVFFAEEISVNLVMNNPKYYEVDLKLRRYIGMSNYTPE